MPLLILSDSLFHGIAPCRLWIRLYSSSPPPPPPPAAPPQDVLVDVRRVVSLAEDTDAGTRDRLLNCLAELISEVDGPRASALVLACGTLVESGGDPVIALVPTLQQLPDVLAAASRFLRRLRGFVARRPRRRRPGARRTKRATPLTNRGIRLHACPNACRPRPCAGWRSSRCAWAPSPCCRAASRDAGPLGASPCCWIVPRAWPALTAGPASWRHAARAR